MFRRLIDLCLLVSVSESPIDWQFFNPQSNQWMKMVICIHMDKFSCHFAHIKWELFDIRFYLEGHIQIVDIESCKKGRKGVWDGIWIYNSLVTSTGTRTIVDQVDSSNLGSSLLPRMTDSKHIWTNQSLLGINISPLIPLY